MIVADVAESCGNDENQPPVATVRASVKNRLENGNTTRKSPLIRMLLKLPSIWSETAPLKRPLVQILSSKLVCPRSPCSVQRTIGAFSVLFVGSAIVRKSKRCHFEQLFRDDHHHSWPRGTQSYSSVCSHDISV